MGWALHRIWSSEAQEQQRSALAPYRPPLIDSTAFSDSDTGAEVEEDDAVVEAV